MTHPIPREALKESVAVVGRTGQGKSYAVRGAVELVLAEGERVCIIDPTGVWWGLRSSTDGKKPGFPVIIFGGDHADVKFDSVDAAKPLTKMIGTQNMPAVLDVSNMTMGERTRVMTAFFDELYRVNRLPLTLVIDEADMFAPQRVMPDQTVLLSRVEQIVRRGRVRGFRPWLITQRPAELHKSVLSQANTLIAMQLTAPQDRDAIGAWIEGQADRDEGKKVLADLPRLQKGEGWVWSPSHGILTRAKFPAIKTFNSMRTPEDGEKLIPTTLATVDLNAIRQQFEFARKEEADNDPKALRARIADLERQVERGPGAPDQSAIHEAYEAGAEAARQAFAGFTERIKQAMLCVVLDTQQIVGDIDKMNNRVAAQYKPPPEPRHVPDVSVEVRRKTPINAGDGKLQKAARAVLTALAQYPKGRTKKQVAILTGYAVNGGGFRNAIGAMRTAGFLEGADTLVITQSGVETLGDFTPLPRGRKLLDHWYGQLSLAERKALSALAEAYPLALTPEDIAKRAGYEATGGGFRNALGKLRTLELISGRAEIRASEELF